MCALVVVVFLENGEGGPNGVRVEGSGGVYSPGDFVCRRDCVVSAVSGVVGVLVVKISMCDSDMGVAIPFRDNLLYMRTGIPTVPIVVWV